MTNSDYLLKATIKKIGEKLNEILVEKIEEATNIAQDAPEIIKRELDNLKESIIEEAERMEVEINKKNYNQSKKANQDPKIAEALVEIVEIDKQIESLNKTINDQT